MINSFNLKEFLFKVFSRIRESIFRSSFKQRKLSKRAIRRLVGAQNVVVFEIGAADGLDTAEFLAEFADPSFRIIAVEPDKRNIAKFEKLILDPRATLFKVAISGSDGLANFHLSSTEYSSSLKVPNLVELQKRWPEMSFDLTTPVNTRSLDSLFWQLDLPRIDFIWADVQGAEDLLISGGVNALKKTRYFYTEYGVDKLYVDEIDLEKILILLGPSWSLLRDYKGDALFRNNSLGV